MVWGIKNNMNSQESKILFGTIMKYKIPKIKNPLYIKFQNGQIYQIHNTKIEFCPNQGLLGLHYAPRYTGGVNFDKSPFLMNDIQDKNLIVEDGIHEYFLTFTNNLNYHLDLFKQPFWIGNIKFILISYCNNRAKCVGYKT